MGIVNRIKQIWRIKDLRDRVLFVVAMLVIFRIAAHIPIPGVNLANLKELFERNEMLGMLNLLSGGAMANFSVVAMGIGPYITASIIMQLLTMIVPRLEELSKQGSSGQQKINQYSRYLTVPMAAIQGYAMIMIFRQSSAQILGVLPALQLLNIILVMVAGTIFLMWLGELISEKNVGNGISLIIFAGIVERLPASLQRNVATFTPDQISNWLILGALAFITIIGIVIITQGQRNIPITFARQIRGNRMYGGRDSYLPLRVNQAGMIPIIFAISIVLFPSLAGNLMTRSATPLVANFGRQLVNMFQNQLIYGATYFILVVAFTYFYTSIIFHPDQIAENLQKRGGFVPGIRPGQPTSSYFKQISNRIMLAGALFLGMIAILPLISKNVFQTTTFTVGGAGILIVVGVVLTTVEQVKAQISMHEYEGM